MAAELAAQDGASPEVVVIGGGPAGSTVSTLLAQQGCRVQLFERERFPRFHIGESLIPETYWVLKRLNMLPKMQESHFTRKYSVQFVNAAGKESAPFYFWDNKPHECSQTWQVVRSEFDKLMLENAREHGVEAREGVRVHEVLFERDRAVGVRVKDDDGFREVRAKVVVDASGQNGLLMNKLNLRVWDPILNKGAIWTYWEGATRDAGRDAGATLVIQNGNRSGWFWYIPLHDNITSIGIVAPFDYLFKGRTDYAKTYDEEVELCPGVKERVAKAKKVTGYFATKDYSYRSKQCSGDGFILIGDAYGFLDPIYSSGVLLGLKMAELAADAIHDAFRHNDFSGERLGQFQPKLDKGIESMRKLVYAFYSEEFSFSKFLQKYPEQRVNVINLLIGDVFKDGVDRVYGPMSEFAEIPPPLYEQIPDDGAAGNGSVAPKEILTAKYMYYEDDSPKTQLEPSL